MSSYGLYYDKALGDARIVAELEKLIYQYENLSSGNSKYIKKQVAFSEILDDLLKLFHEIPERENKVSKLEYPPYPQSVS